jgi:hypothetical protein
MGDGRRVGIVPGAGAVVTQNSDMSHCHCVSREGNRALAVKTMQKYEWREGGREAEIGDELGQSLEFCYLYRWCTH